MASRWVLFHECIDPVNGSYYSNVGQYVAACEIINYILAISPSVCIVLALLSRRSHKSLLMLLGK